MFKPFPAVVLSVALIKKIMAVVLSFFETLVDVPKVEIFLDKERRPGASVVTESFVLFEQRNTMVEVDGVLGAIESHRKAGSYVAFSGVEISASLFLKSDQSLQEQALTVSLQKLYQVENMSVQLVLKKGGLFAIDLSLNSQEGLHVIPFESFKESFRGQISDTSFEGEFDDIKSVRFYLKRSEISPLSKEPLNYKFQVGNLVTHAEGK